MRWFVHLGKYLSFKSHNKDVITLMSICLDTQWQTSHFSRIESFDPVTQLVEENVCQESLKYYF